jgi:hypothetical protein
MEKERQMEVGGFNLDDRLGRQVGGRICGIVPSFAAAFRLGVRHRRWPLMALWGLLGDYFHNKIK